MYVVLTQLQPAARKTIDQNPGRLAEVNARVKQLGGQIALQYAVLGAYDFVTFVEAADNTAIALIGAEISGLGTMKMHTFPAIEMERFAKLLKMEPYRTEPHRWQTSFWAQILRRAGRRWVTTRHVSRYCRPFEVQGAGNLKQHKGGAIIIANHSSHFDTPVVLTALPARIRDKTIVAAAADKFYGSRKKRTWWYSLFHGTFPVHRGGGTKQLEYPVSLLQRGWSVLIYPEGGRSKGPVQKFKHGPAIMAMQAKVPVIPVYIEGLRRVMPKGQREPRPAPVRAFIGAPVLLPSAGSVPEATTMLENAMRDLAGMPPHHAAQPVVPAAEAAMASTGGGP
ncbi:MAG: GYD domain-containing protein [Chloroflexota bacterium]|nr:GYD domain-containing protein [Chloroflexota bacterium]